MGEKDIGIKSGVLLFLKVGTWNGFELTPFFDFELINYRYLVRTAGIGNKARNGKIVTIGYTNLF